MKTLSISALIFTLTATPAGAAMVTVNDGDGAAHCGLTSARLIGDWSERASEFPDELRACAELDNEAAEETKSDRAPNAAVTVPAAVNPSLEIAALFRPAND